MQAGAQTYGSLSAAGLWVLASGSFPVSGEACLPSQVSQMWPRMEKAAFFLAEPRGTTSPAVCCLVLGGSDQLHWQGWNKALSCPEELATKQQNTICCCLPSRGGRVGI